MASTSHTTRLIRSSGVTMKFLVLLALVVAGVGIHEVSSFHTGGVISQNVITEHRNLKHWMRSDRRHRINQCQPHHITLTGNTRNSRYRHRISLSSPSPSRAHPPQGLHSSRKDLGDQDAPVLIREELGCSPTLSTIVNAINRWNQIFASASSSSTSSTSSTSVRQQDIVRSSFSSSSSSAVPFFFDPLQLADDSNFASYRESELKHGRVAMLAVVGTVGVTYYKDRDVKSILGEVWRQWFASSAFIQQQPTSGSNNNNDVDDNDILNNPLSSIVGAVSSSSSSSSSVSPSLSTSTTDTHLLDQLRHLPVPKPLHLFQEWTVGDFGRMVFVCGIVETLVWVQTDPQSMPGDYGTGYFGVRDKGLHERSLVAELENGRLCMLVMLYYVVFGDLWQFYTDLVVPVVATNGGGTT